ncbi:replication initiation protein [Saccharopolyspora erythraea]|uniref:replication initiator n=1 Tax=Saccharopolyspora erythraea TaxID=1836 RepID=UPI001BAB97A9|nr:replication initiator [Saccharopolyspora erythraea]QUG99380.1 replication initiation protein [Saccharopolyspora erythraea]
MSVSALLTPADYQRQQAADGMARHMQSPGYQQWRAEVESTGGCTHPIRMTGRWALTDAVTGAILPRSDGRPSERHGQILVPCGNRRESVCVACSDRYAADAFHLLRAGLNGGTKGVPVDVADKPRVFLTLTAPSFGPVHNRPTRNGKTLPCRCGTYHHPADPRLGQPVEPEAYDYTGHVLWNAHAGKLWSLFTKYLRRHLAVAAGIRVADIRDHFRLSFAKVAEYQRRGTIHFHAVVRLDGPDGPDDATPAWGSVELLTDAIHSAHAAVSVTSPVIDGQAHQLAWGEQVDVRPIRPASASQVEDEHGAISDDRIASYVAKYATKGTGKSEATDRPIRSQGHIDRLAITEHHRRIIQTAWDLGAPVICPECHPDGEHQADGCGCEAVGHCETCQGGGWATRTAVLHRHDPEAAARGKPDPIDELKLRHWAHMLAFRGHFLSKSRAYSTTFKQIRGDRQTWRHENALAEAGVTDEDTVTVINHWDMVRIGHDTDDARELAEAIAERTRQTRKHRYSTERKD